MKTRYQSPFIQLDLSQSFLIVYFPGVAWTRQGSCCPTPARRTAGPWSRSRCDGKLRLEGSNFFTLPDYSDQAYGRRCFRRVPGHHAPPHPAAAHPGHVLQLVHDRLHHVRPGAVLAGEQTPTVHHVYFNFQELTDGLFLNFLIGTLLDFPAKVAKISHI